MRPEELPSVLWCDFGGVLTPPIRESIASMEEATGLDWDDLWAAAEVVAARHGLRGLGPLELGLVSESSWGAQVTEALRPEHRSRVDLGDWGEYWYRGRRPESRLLAELATWSSRGVRLGLLTNSVAEWEARRAELVGAAVRFDAAVKSHEVGLAKPDPRIYLHADAVLPAGSGRPLLIDDSSDNCDAAARHGWATICHVDADSTIGLLRSRFSL